MRKVFVTVSVFLCCTVLSAQTKTTTTFNRTWLGYFNQARFSDRWGIWAEAQLRSREDFVEGVSQSILRAGLTYYAGDNTKLTAGYAFVNDFPGDNHKNISAPEHRPWQQVQWHTKYGNKKMMQWIRLEERYRHKIKNDDALADGYNFNWRIRYNLWYEIPFLTAAKKIANWSFIVNDEVHVNFGKQIVNNYFDQNRFFIGFKYQTASNSNLQLGYMNVFQQLAAGSAYRNFNVIRCFYFQNIDLRKKKN